MRGVKIAVIIVILFAVSILYGNLTGGAFRTTSEGGLLGQHLNNHPEREMTVIELIGHEVDEDGNYIYKKGYPIEFIVKPGKNGVITGAAVRNAVSDLKIWGSHCSRGSSADFCSNSYQCVDKDPKKCSITGIKCYGDKLVKAKLPREERTGQFVVTVCDGSDECNDCVEIRSNVFRIE